MIQNERQYHITKAQARKFREALAAFEAKAPDAHPVLVKAQRDALESQLAELDAQLKEYETLRSGKVTKLKKSSFRDLPAGLIRARIAKGLTQKELARKLGIKEQQIQRYEETDYASASLSRINRVIQALNIEVTEEISIDRARGSTRSRAR